MRKKIPRSGITSLQSILWMAVADAASRGMVCCPEAPTLDAALWRLTQAFASCTRRVDDDLRASLALSEACLWVKPARWRQDGFAYGIRRRKGCGTPTVRVPGFFHPIAFADWIHDRLFHTVKFGTPRKVKVVRHDRIRRAR